MTCFRSIETCSFTLRLIRSIWRLEISGNYGHWTWGTSSWWTFTFKTAKLMLYESATPALNSSLTTLKKEASSVHSCCVWQSHPVTQMPLWRQERNKVKSSSVKATASTLPSRHFQSNVKAILKQSNRTDKSMSTVLEG